MEPFRFVHAARVLLDHQLHGIAALPDELRPLVEDATLVAFDAVVETCLSRQVDFLLLAGDSFDQRDCSLRGPAALVRGIERLAEQNIRVVIAAGLTDPWSAWPEGMRLPANAVRLGIDAESEIALSRDGKLLAVVRDPTAPDPLAAPEAECVIKLPLGGAGPFTIVLQHAGREAGPPLDFIGSHAAAGPAGDYADANYWASGGRPQAQSLAREQRLLHDPGPTQAVRPLETGPRGCTLVDVSATGEIRTEFIATAPVRYERFNIEVLPDTTRDGLLAVMREALAQTGKSASDRLWLPAWRVSGAGPMLAVLAEPQTREAFLDELHARHSLEGLAIHTQAVRVHYGTGGEANADLPDELACEYERTLLDHVTHSAWSLQMCLEESSLANGPWQGQLSSLLAELDAGEVVEDALRLGLEWFAAAEAPSP